MKYEITDKERILESLIAIRRQGQLSEINLRLQNKTIEADKVWEYTSRLSIEIDILIGRMMDEWLSAADLVTAALMDANTKITSVVTDIKEQIKIASNVIAVLRYLDDAVVIAKKVVVGV